MADTAPKIFWIIAYAGKIRALFHYALNIKVIQLTDMLL